MKFEDVLAAARLGNKIYRSSWPSKSESFYIQDGVIMYEECNGDENAIELDMYEGLSSQDIMAEDWEIR